MVKSEIRVSKTGPNNLICQKCGTETEKIAQVGLAKLCACRKCDPNLFAELERMGLLVEKEKEFDRRFGLQVGDTVQPTAEYEELFHKSFYATILFFKETTNNCIIAILEKDNGERDSMNVYWLKKVNR